MPKRITALSDVQVRNAKPQEKDVKLFDGGGLFLLVTPTGGKLWRFKYSFGGMSKLLALGIYPQISLAEARQRREDAKKLLANGVNPGAVKKAQKAAGENGRANSFEVVAREWHEKFKDSWAASHAHAIITRLEKNVFPWLGDRPIAEIEAPEVLAVLRRMEDRGAVDTARRMKIVSGQVFPLCGRNRPCKTRPDARSQRRFKTSLYNSHGRPYESRGRGRADAVDLRLQRLICCEERPWDAEKLLVEDCMRLDISRLMRKNQIKTLGIYGGTLTWTSGSSISVTLKNLNPHQASMTLSYTITNGWTGEKTPIEQTIRLEYTLPNFGGKRWWARCQLWKNGRYCGRRVSKLYLPSGGHYFGCRTCYGLVYQSSRDSHKYDGLYGVIGANLGVTV
ncbi:DUF4102 domain-containing protein [bacterium]|nr:MAG: DUF4102 domain-containing protein [bacterium]